MAILTELPFDAAEQILLRYQLHLLELKPLSAGSVNSNFFLRAQDQGGKQHDLFARIYEEQGNAGAEFELRLNLVLAGAHLPVAQPLLQTDGSLTSTFAGKPFALYHRVAGEVTCQARVNERRCYSVGRALAHVHCADLKGLELKPSRFGFEQIRERLLRVEAAGRASLLPAVEQIRVDCDRIERSRALDLPQGLIHGDLFRDNVLLNDDEVSGLLDFESASRGAFVYDLMVTALAWCFGQQLEEDLLLGLLAGYTSVRALSAEERGALVTEGSVACLRFATTRLTDFSLRVADGQTPGRDYRRFFQRQKALESGILDRVLARLS